MAYGIWNTVLATRTTPMVVPFALLVPIVGILAVWLVVHEVQTVTELVGGAAVLLAGLAILVVVREARKRHPPALDLMAD